jgi:K+-transporting ATPase ATPase A chain
MSALGWLQIVLLYALVLVAVKPLGGFMATVFEGGRTSLSPVLAPVERGFYRLAGIDEGREQGWRAYALAMLAFNAAGFAVLYLIMRMQGVLTFNPQGFAGVEPGLAFNTAISFVTNTNWQSYGGETTMSHFTQMAGLAVQNFLSAATGIALAVALTRAFARSGAREVGNFWVDMVRSTLYVLLPLSLVFALAFVFLGEPQSLLASVQATTIEGAPQNIALGPVASQEAIKMLGTNGGGFFNANSAHPFENPTPLTNLLEMWSIIAISAALTFTFGSMVKDRRQGWALLAVMGALLVAATAIAYWAEGAGNPILTGLGLDGAGGNMEGKEVRFGVANSALWSTLTTGASNGSVNAMHDSFTPLGGLMPLFLIKLGEILPGGVGSGLYGMVVFAIIAVFVAGLMVGRTPEYLGKKIEAREMKLAVLAILLLPAALLGFAAVAALIPAGTSSLNNAGPHGLSEILYAYSSAVGNNGSAFAGLNANTPWFNTTLGIAMFLGRFAVIVPVMGIAGSIAAKTKGASSPGTFPTHGPLFVGLVMGVILILGGLQYFPALALGPIVEHFLMLAGQTF